MTTSFSWEMKFRWNWREYVKDQAALVALLFVKAIPSYAPCSMGSNSSSIHNFQGYISEFLIFGFKFFAFCCVHYIHRILHPISVAVAASSQALAERL